MNKTTTTTTAASSSWVELTVVAESPDRRMKGAGIPSNFTDRELLTHPLFSVVPETGGRGSAVDRRCPHGQAMKYLAFGWWQMMAVVDCSGWSWNPSLTSTPMRSAPSSWTTLALSSRAGQAGYPHE
jgi:hypothetical protein